MPSMLTCFGLALSTLLAGDFTAADQDTSLADAPATTLSTDVVDLNGNQLPVQYELQYNEDDIDDRNTYTVFARIEAGGSLLYITDTAYPVITRGNPTEDVMVEVVPTG